MLRVLVLSPMPEGLMRLFFAESLEKSNLEADFVTVNEPGSERLGPSSGTRTSW